ncbi:MAG: coenzyme F420-0:L-glutamate ligase, partial [Synergistaceae bacterium]|nr:coenzyme F420-0:L-glutamate ligase [Synergistaceae bacterium]
MTSSIIKASAEEGFDLHDGDVVGVTEAVVARTQGNYATCDQIAADVRAKLGDGVIGLVFPILSRNRFAIMLRAFARAAAKLVVQLSYPSDEVGNALLTWDQVDAAGVDPYRDSFTLEQFRAKFGNDTVHKVTGVDYIEYYRTLGENVEVVFSNDPRFILNYTKNVINCDIHTRRRTERILKEAGANVCAMDELMTAPVGGSGFNPKYGLLGSNKATEEKVKLFPRDADVFVESLSRALYEATGKHIEVMVYGDGGFKDPVGGIWELADPVVSPAYTEGLEGTPNELKMKYFADNEFASLSGEALAEAMRSRIREKDKSLVGNMQSQGTTPRRLTDL